MKLRNFIFLRWKCWLRGHEWPTGYDPHRPITARYGLWEIYCRRSHHTVTIDYGEKEQDSPQHP